MVLSKQAILRSSNALPVQSVKQVHLLFNGDAPHATPICCVDEDAVLSMLISEVVLFMLIDIRSCVVHVYIRSCVLSGCLRSLCNCCDWQVSIWRWRSRVHQHQMLCVRSWMDSSVVTLTEVDVGPLRDTRFAVLVNTSVKEVGVLYILHINFI